MVDHYVAYEAFLATLLKWNLVQLAELAAALWKIKGMKSARRVNTLPKPFFSVSRKLLGLKLGHEYYLLHSGELSLQRLSYNFRQ
jgi:hypothetical protein